MRIGELAKRLGISRDTIRRLERRGLLAPKRDWAGHRRFTEADLERIRNVLFRERSATSEREALEGVLGKAHVRRLLRQ